MSAISIKNLCKSFQDVKALADVNLDIDKGAVFGVLGPDGAGKTTLLRILAGVMTADSGTVNILGFDITADIESAKQHIGYLSQRFSLYPDLTVSENIDFYSRLFKVDKLESYKRKAKLLDFSRLEPYADRTAKHLSGGMKQKLALSCALIHTPKILILDEPTTGVDPISRREFWKILYDLLTEGVTIIFATPYMDEAERANRVALLHEGKILSCETPEYLKQQYSHHLVGLITDNNRLCRNLLQDEFGAQNVLFFGDKLHIKIQDYDAGVQAITNILQQAGIELLSIERIVPGMEDVFIDAIT
ncbi:MAG: ABC transporter ATP-binding protein [candidate division Zixibacteria bacterium]|nr:ABC transporter ATP-binding protein [candidate division Zixibacteria bacterium]